MTLLVLIVAGAPAYAQSIQWDWDGISSQYWSVATNWNPQDVPDALNETATIGEAGIYTVELNISPTIQHLLITNPTATLDMWGSRTLTVTEWNGVTNYGTILADSSTSIVGAVINHGTYETPGGISSIVGPVTNEAVSPEGIRIRGPSSMELYGPVVTNNGTIHINYNGFTGIAPTYLHFKADTTLDGAGEVIMNRNSRLTSDVGITLTQGADHTIRGKGNLGARLVNEGTVRADDPSFYLTLDENPKTNYGTLVADADCRMDIFGAFLVTQGNDGMILADGGTINFRSTSTSTPLTIVGGSLGTLNGGTLHAASSDTQLIDVTLAGSLDVDFGAAVVVAGAGITNNGTIRVDPTATPSFTHFVFVEDGELSGAGELILGRGYYARLFVDDGLVGTNGVEHTIRGAGVLRGSFVNDGTIAPGMSIGQIDAFSPTTITQGSTGIFEFELAGTGTSEYDRMTGAAAYVLDGILRVSVVPPYVPSLGHAYTIISGSSVDGTFAAIEGAPPGAGLDWELTYTASTVVLSVVPCNLNITEQPQSRTVCRGTQVTMSVTATGAKGYQWRLGGDNIDGATDSTYFISYAQPLHSGNYDVVVTSQCGLITSANASLSVLDGGSGDVDGDGDVDGLDVQGFTMAMLAGGPVDAGYCAADMNGNGAVDEADIEAFVYWVMNQ